ncbi:MAG: Lrp/AsnC family transcriptional regulator, partial [Geminicoccaceae bacterium]
MRQKEKEFSLNSAIDRKWRIFFNLTSSYEKNLLRRAETMDATDRQILDLLQRDATMPLAEIARKVGLSSTPCWRRIQ